MLSGSMDRYMPVWKALRWSYLRGFRKNFAEYADMYYSAGAEGAGARTMWSDLHRHLRDQEWWDGLPLCDKLLVLLSHLVRVRLHDVMAYLVRTIVLRTGLLYYNAVPVKRGHRSDLHHLNIVANARRCGSDPSSILGKKANQ